MHNWCDSLENAGLCNSLPTHNWASHTSGNGLFSRSTLCIILKQAVEVQLETWREDEIHAGQNWQKPLNATKKQNLEVFCFWGGSRFVKICFPEGFASVHLLRLKSALWFVLTYTKWLHHIKHTRQLLIFYWERAQSQARGLRSCRLFFCVNDSRKAFTSSFDYRGKQAPGEMEMRWRSIQQQRRALAGTSP